MWRKALIAASVLTFAFSILFISVFRTASIKYEFSGPSLYQNRVLGQSDVNINYQLPYPGKILPDSALWPVKALRDRVWLFLTTSDTRKAELKLLFADKRLGSAKILFERGKPEIAFTTLTKAEKYLEEAVIKEKENRAKNIDTSEFLLRLANASLKHYQLMEEMLTVAPDDAKPGIIRTQDYAKRAYEETRNALLEKGMTPPENPFAW